MIPSSVDEISFMVETIESALVCAIQTTINDIMWYTAYYSALTLRFKDV